MSFRPKAKNDIIFLFTMQILWLDLNSSYAHSSLALPALHAQMNNFSTVRWSVVSATVNENPGAIATEICRHAPDLIAATCWLFNHEMLMHVLSRAQAMLPSCKIALGGPEFLGGNEHFLRSNSFVTCVFRGEGEEAFPQWITCINEPEKWKNITGLCYIDERNNYHDNGIARVASFETLANPEQSAFFNWSKPFVQLETTRGCFNTCAFCVSGGEKPVRTIPIETIRKRIQVIHAHGIRNIRVLDRTFNYNGKHAKALLDIFREFPDMHFHLEIHPALLSDEVKKELTGMPDGLLHLEAGIQSLHEEALTLSRRMGNLKDSLDGLRFLCSLSNMETHADLIAGLPSYRLEEIFADIRTLAEYGAGEIQLESLKLLPGTEMRRRAKELGICYSPLPPYEVLQTKDISADELITAGRLSRLLDGFYNTSAWQKLTRELILREDGFLSRFLSHLTDINVIDQPLSLERRGIILYDFCRTNYPAYESKAAVAWIEAGMSLKKKPAEKVKTKHVTLPENLEIKYGHPAENMRCCMLPDGNMSHWFGFSTEDQQAKPILYGITHSA